MPAGDEGTSADRPPAVDAEPSADRPRPVEEEQTAERPPNDDATGRSDREESDAATGGPPPAGEQSDEEAVGPTEGAGGRREVEVPQSLYRVVTVFSTLLSVLFVVLGFVVLDAATTVSSNPPGSVVVRLLSILGPSVETLSTYSSTIAVVVGLLGLALVVAGAGVYVYGSRFRAPGMGKPKDEADEGTGDG